MHRKLAKPTLALLGFLASSWATSALAACANGDTLERGACELEQHRPLEALIAFRGGSVSAPQSVATQCSIGIALAELGRYQEAEGLLVACPAVPAGERSELQKQAATDPQAFSAKKHCPQCGELTITLPDEIPDGTSIEQLDLITTNEPVRPLFSVKEGVTLPAKLVVILPVKAWQVRSTWRRDDGTAVTESDIATPVDAVIGVVDPAVALLQLPHADDFSKAPNPRAIHHFTHGFELYGRVDVAPLAPAGGALNLGVAYQFSRHFELAAAGAVSPRLVGAWAGISGMLGTTERGRIGVVAGVPMFFANIGSASVKPPTPLVGLQLGLAYRQGFGDERASGFLAAAVQHYPWLDSEKFHRTLLLLSVGAEYGLF